MQVVSVRLQPTCKSLTTVVEQFTTEVMSPHVDGYMMSKSLQGSLFFPGMEVPSTVERAAELLLKEEAELKMVLNRKKATASGVTKGLYFDLRTKSTTCAAVAALALTCSTQLQQAGNA